MRIKKCRLLHYAIFDNRIFCFFNEWTTPCFSRTFWYESQLTPTFRSSLFSAPGLMFLLLLQYVASLRSSSAYVEAFCDVSIGRLASLVSYVWDTGGKCPFSVVSTYRGCKREPPVVANIHRRDVTFHKLRLGQTEGQTELFLLYIDKTCDPY